MSSDNESNSSRNEIDAESDVEEGLKDMAKLKSSQLKTQLKRDGILFNDNDNQHLLQATLALSKLDILPAGELVPRDVVVEVAEWCSLTVPKLNEILEARDIKVKGNKWANLERLMLSEFVVQNEKTRKAVQKTSKTGKNRTVEFVLGKNIPLIEPGDVHPPVVNLLLSCIYNTAFFHKRTNLIKGYKTNQRQDLLKHLDNIPTIDDAPQLESLLSGNDFDPTTKILGRLCSPHGSRFVVLGRKHQLQGFPTGTIQFAVLGSTGPQLSVERRSEAGNGPGGILLFHGTPLSNLLPILKDGFDSPEPGLAITAEPNHVLRYAHNIWSKKASSWKNSPFQDYGALLGCQVAGLEKPLPNESIVLEYQNLATIRYLFLVPAPVMGPARETIVGSMLAGFKAIGAGEARTLEDVA